MGINLRHFWRGRTDLLILFVMLSFVFGLWSFGVKIDKSSEGEIENELSIAYSETSKIITENQGVMKSVAGFYFGSSSVTTEELKTFLGTLFDGRVWGGVRLVEVWQDGKKIDEVVFGDSVGEVVFFDQSFEKDGRKLTIKTAISLDNLVNTISMSLSEKVGLEIVLDGKSVFETAKVKYRKEILQEKTVTFGGMNIDLRLAVDDKPSDTWVVFLGLGIILSFVIYALVFSMTTSGRSAEYMAKEMVGDLMKYKKAINSLDSHLVITDLDGNVIFANPAVFELTGFSEKEVLGGTPRLWGRQMSREFYRNMWDTIKNKKEVFKGEVVNKRKDGSSYTAYAVISPIIDENGELLGFVGSETDITERKQLEDEQKRMNELMVGREVAMVELKKRIAKLENEHV